MISVNCKRDSDTSISRPLFSNVAYLNEHWTPRVEFTCTTTDEFSNPPTACTISNGLRNVPVWPFIDIMMPAAPTGIPRRGNFRPPTVFLETTVV